MAAPAALIPDRPTLRHRLRARRVRSDGTPMIGRDVRIAGDVFIGDRASVGDGTTIEGNVRIEAGAVLGERCRIVAFAGVAIGRNALLGDGVVLTDFSPTYDDVERPTRAQPLRAEPIEIGAGARVGHGACLLRGARVPPGGDVAPHSVTGRR